MTSPIEPTSIRTQSIGAQENGDPRIPKTHGIAVLDSFIHRDSRWCVRCGGPQLFVEVYECEAGRVGVCFGCGEERVIPFSRTNSEVA